MQDLKVALVQADLVWEDAAANLRAFEAKLARIESGTHLIVLPEMFATGFSMQPQRLAQSMDGAAAPSCRRTR
jgi:predicted amidohydrolase